VPRSVRRKTRDITAARNALAAKLCRQPEDHEVAAELKVDVQTLWKWESDVEGAIRVPIDRPANDRGEQHSSPLDLLHTDPDQGVDTQLGKEQEVGMLREAIMRLKEQERQGDVVQLHHCRHIHRNAVGHCRHILCIYQY